jgi:hypothetical protein
MLVRGVMTVVDVKSKSMVPRVMLARLVQLRCHSQLAAQLAVTGCHGL